MRDKAELAVTIENAKQAEAIVNHPLFIASIKMLRALTIDKFENLKFNDVSAMQECNIRLNIIEEFEINLSTVIHSGNAAFKALEDIQTFEQETQR